MKKAVVIITSTCYSSRTDFDLIRSWLKENGWKLVRRIENADLVIVHTCAYVKAKEDQSIMMIKVIKSNMQKNSRLIVTGCLPAINKNRLGRIFKGVSISSKYLHQLEGSINGKVKFRDTSFIEPTGISLNKLGDKPQPGYLFKEYRLRIGRGCNGRCSYCVIRRVFGKPQSRPILEISREFRTALKKGYKKFVLVANEVGAYGEDTGSDVVELITSLAAVSSTAKFAISNITPDKLKELLPRLKKFIYKKRIWRINVPVQSGSEAVLTKMKRSYAVYDFKSAVEEIFKVNSEILIETDIMVGFPSESKSDFYQTVLLTEWLNKHKVFSQVFPYDPRPHTPSILIAPQVGRREKQKRFERIEFLCSSYFAMRNKMLLKKWKNEWKIKR